MSIFSKFIGSEYIVCKETFSISISNDTEHIFYKDVKYKCKIQTKKSIYGKLREGLIVWVGEDIDDVTPIYDTEYFHFDIHTSDYAVVYFYTQSEYKPIHRKNIIDELID